MILTNNGKILMSPDGKVYSGSGSGGSNIAKLVATGTYNSEDDVFNLDNELEAGKVYYAKLFLNVGYEFSGLLLVSFRGVCSNLIMCMDEEDDHLVLCEMYYGNNQVYVYSMNGENLLIGQIEETTIEIYELFTLGGN